MPQPTPEFEGLLQLIVFLECKIDAVIELLHDKGVKLTIEEIESRTHKIHAVQRYSKKFRIKSLMKDGKFDV
jgi:hypothetical protein